MIYIENEENRAYLEQVDSQNYFTFMNVLLESSEDEEFFTEADLMETYFIRDELYPRIAGVLKTPEGSRKFSELVQNYVNRNNSKLTTVGPMYLIPFTNNDKADYYKLFGLEEQEIVELVMKMTKAVNEKANWLLLKNNPIFIVLYCIIRFYTIAKDSKKLNNALAITALAFYPSMFTKYFRFEPNAGVMRYTIDNLSQRFIIKKSNHIFGALTYSIQNSWKFHEKRFVHGSDQDCIAFIQRIRNDQNSLLKKITNNYQDNYRNGRTVYTTVDSYDDAIVVDHENDSNRVAGMVDKIVLQLTVNGVDLRLCDFASNAAGISKIDLRNYITQIAVDKNVDDMKTLIESILFIFLYDEKHPYEEIKDKKFIAFALALFKKTNSKNSNIQTMKKLLDKFCTDTGIYGKFTRVATRVNYSKAIYLYFILTIQKYS